MVKTDCFVNSVREKKSCRIICFFRLKYFLLLQIIKLLINIENKTAIFRQSSISRHGASIQKNTNSVEEWHFFRIAKSDSISFGCHRSDDSNCSIEVKLWACETLKHVQKVSSLCAWSKTRSYFKVTLIIRARINCKFRPSCARGVSLSKKRYVAERLDRLKKLFVTRKLFSLPRYSLDFTWRGKSFLWRHECFSWTRRKTVEETVFYVVLDPFFPGLERVRSKARLSEKLWDKMIRFLGLKFFSCVFFPWFFKVTTLKISELFKDVENEIFPHYQYSVERLHLAQIVLFNY